MLGECPVAQRLLLASSRTTTVQLESTMQLALAAACVSSGVPERLVYVIGKSYGPLKQS